MYVCKIVCLNWSPCGSSCQDVLLDNMKLGPNIAKNAALRENVFMMAICVELRIPLFLVGKPGSSKSLAKSIISSSMQGSSSSSDHKLLRNFKQVFVCLCVRMFKCGYPHLYYICMTYT